MKIDKNLSGDTLTVALHGSLDTTTAPLLSDELKLDGVKTLAFDLSDLTYVASAGLRVFLVAFETVRKAGGTMSFTGVQESVRKVFDLVGFSRVIPMS